jgi:hypothetical protein
MSWEKITSDFALPKIIGNFNLFMVDNKVNDSCIPLIIVLISTHI